MTQHNKLGLVVGFGFILLTTPIGLLSANNPAWNRVGQLLVLPALPVVYLLVHYFPPPMGESEMVPWDYFMGGVGIQVSACIWGLLARWASRYFRANRDGAS